MPSSYLYVSVSLYLPLCLFLSVLSYTTATADGGFFLPLRLVASSDDRIICGNGSDQHVGVPSPSASISASGT
ncbi:hypothetical protein L2E82_35837 [Cichorium intybus]|uniref:Uncharacterized protein n=1 Tax=Cichorium intybus TaxID=13427 RepID=A0ACB9BQ03_CICIN|nr:hypothetical protein L2E82_35837 [Cichorium intybus]